MRLGPYALAAAVAVLLVAAAPAGASIVDRADDRTHPPPVPYGLEAAAFLPEDPTGDFFVHPAAPTSEAPAEARLSVGPPDDDRTAEATLTVRPATAPAEHPTYTDLHSPRTYEFQVEWTKDPGLDDPGGATDHHTATWQVQLQGEPAGIPLAVEGVWTPVTYWGSCTADSPPPASCAHDAVGPVALNGTWGEAEITFTGMAHDGYCTVPDDDPTVDTPYTNPRDAGEC